MPLDNSSAWDVDLLVSGSEEDIYLYLKYYADDATRRKWPADFPDYRTPEHEQPSRLLTVTGTYHGRITGRRGTWKMVKSCNQGKIHACYVAVTSDVMLPSQRGVCLNLPFIDSP